MMKTKYITSNWFRQHGFVTGEYRNGFVLRTYPSGWQVQFDERVLSELDDSLFDAISYGIAECIIGHTILGLPLRVGKPASIEIPSTKTERGGICNVHINYHTKIAFIIGYISAGKFVDNPNPLVVLEMV